MVEYGVYTLNGREFIACHGDAGGYILYTWEEWFAGTLADMEADADGQILCQGESTGYTIADLVFTGRVVNPERL